MTLGEKLSALRKEHRLSQENLADKLGTTRQAVSKWENDQGFPDTERLLLLSNVFGVSVDYLLKSKGEDNISKENEHGYYASKEFINGYLASEKRCGLFFGLWASTLILMPVPYLYRGNWSALTLMLTISFAIISFGFFIVLCLNDKQEYDVIKKEALIIDKQVLQEIKDRYRAMSVRIFVLLFLGLAAILAGGIPFLLVHRDFIPAEIIVPYRALLVLLIAPGAFVFSISLATIEAYDIIVDNVKYSNRFSAKLSKKIKRKIDDLLS